MLPTVMHRMPIVLFAILVTAMVGKQLFSAQSTPRQQPGAEVSFYAPEQHDLYDGRWVLSASRIYQVGRLNDPPGWDHIDNDGSDVHAVDGTVEIDVDEIENTGTFIARLQLPAGELCDCSW